MRVLFLIFLIFFLSSGTGRADTHPHIISLNLCTDQLLILLADPAQIIGLSPLARDCSVSVLCQEAREFPVIRPDGEDILIRHPDIIVSGPWSARPALAAARLAGLRTEIFAPASGLEDIPEQIRRVAVLAGHPERGRAMADAFSRRLKAISIPVTPASPVAAIYGARGYIATPPSLLDDILRHAGFRNLVSVSDHYMSLENIIARQPDILITDSDSAGVSRAENMMQHPALQKGFPGKRHIRISGRLWLCGLPQTADAVAQLIRAAGSADKNHPDGHIK